MYDSDVISYHRYNKRNSSWRICFYYVPGNILTYITHLIFTTERSKESLDIGPKMLEQCAPVQWGHLPGLAPRKAPPDRKSLDGRQDPHCPHLTGSLWENSSRRGATVKYTQPTVSLGLPWWLSSTESACQCRRHGFVPWVWKIRKWQPTPVFLPGKCHGQRSLWAVVHGVTKSRTRLSN